MQIILLVLLFNYLPGEQLIQRPNTTELPGTVAENAQQFLALLNKEQQAQCYRSFDDQRRKTWDRIPMIREGIKLSKLNLEQKQVLHHLLQRCLSSKGYLLATTIMFNEDIQQKFEPNLGRNEFWVEFFGEPSDSNFWAWQLEGHHLSLNFTFNGNSLISYTPFFMGSKPQVVDSDDDRNGFCFIYAEESIAGEIMESFSPEQKATAYSNDQLPINVFGEVYKDSLYSPYTGIDIDLFFHKQGIQLENLVREYKSYFPAIENDILGEELNGKSYFYFMGDQDYRGKHYYSLKNKRHFIECENYGNHTHHLYRSTNDFGEEYYQVK